MVSKDDPKVKEEVNLEITNIQYFGSQSWPFPNQLMLGFIVNYLDGEINICPKELNDANWFKKENPPQLLPNPYSIARQMIDYFLNK